ncbi:MAG: hypothetical protein PUP92_36745, partial [Rhizonema sp. PD38]|nr:hypothetical protein [Rhizonema sp. PD38]
MQEEDRDWRDSLPNMLEKLSHILDIPTIVQAINQTSQSFSSVGEELKKKSESKLIQDLRIDKLDKKCSSEKKK